MSRNSEIIYIYLLCVCVVCVCVCVCVRNKNDHSFKIVVNFYMKFNHCTIYECMFIYNNRKSETVMS